jgi:hypothetical protein
MYDVSKKYTRTEIMGLVGGEIQTYLPQKEGIILAGCFNLELNPDCPIQIQAGNAEKVKKKAELLIGQPDTVFPVFVKETQKDSLYRYIGLFRCISGTSESSILSEAEAKSGRYGKLSYVFNLDPVT